MQKAKTTTKDVRFSCEERSILFDIVTCLIQNPYIKVCNKRAASAAGSVIHLLFSVVRYPARPVADMLEGGRNEKLTVSVLTNEL